MARAPLASAVARVVSRRSTTLICDSRHSLRQPLRLACNHGWSWVSGSEAPAQGEIDMLEPNAPANGGHHHGAPIQIASGEAAIAGPATPANEAPRQVRPSEDETKSAPVNKFPVADIRKGQPDD